MGKGRVMGGWLADWMVGRVDEWVDQRKEVYMYVWIDGRVSGWMCGWKDG